MKRLLIQTCGRAARNVNGRVIMYADKITNSIQNTLTITQDRRAIQQAYNQEHNITPRSVRRELIQDLAETFGEVVDSLRAEEKIAVKHIDAEDIDQKIKDYELEMRRAAKEMRFEDAAHFRDLMHHYQKLQILSD